jgi:hypothetical protein
VDDAEEPVTEDPDAERAIVAVPTAVAAFVGAFPRGPLQEPVAVASLADFADLFAAPDGTSAAALAVAQFFANGGGAAIVVRVGSGPLSVVDLVGEEGEGTGLFALEAADLFNLL